MQNVAFTPYSSSTASTSGVHRGSGPSSMVMLTPRGPLSEACAMVTATGAGSPPAVADADGRGGVALTVPACAVHTAAPAASTVTPSAAPTTLPYQPRPPP